MRATAEVEAIDEDGEPQPEQVYGTLEWTNVGYGAAVAAQPLSSTLHTIPTTWSAADSA